MSQSFRVRPRRATESRVNMPVSNESLYTRPSSADGGKRTKPPKRHHSNSHKPKLRKLAKKFLRSNKEEDMKLKIPPGFFDEYDTPHRSLSPDSPFQRNRYYSVGNRTALKIKRIGKDKEEPFFMWKPCKVCVMCECMCVSVYVCLFVMANNSIVVCRENVNGRACQEDS